MPSTRQVHDRLHQVVAEGLMRIAEVEDFLGLSRSSVYVLMDSGALPWVRIGRARRIPRRAVHELAASLIRGGQVRNAGGPADAQ